MRTRTARGLLAAIALAWPAGEVIAGGDLPCARLRPIWAMARAGSIVELEAARAPADEGDAAQLVLATRAFELEPRSTARAAALLDVLPMDDDEELAFDSAAFVECGEGSEAGRKALDGMRERLPRDAARAALLVPSRMAPYVAFAEIAIHDEHSDFAVWMAKVCRERHAELLQAVRELPAERRAWFAEEVLVPEGCRILHFAEAEDGDLTCDEMQDVVTMAGARSLRALDAAKARADKRALTADAEAAAEMSLARMVYAVRAFQLQPRSRQRAAALLATLPMEEKLLEEQRTKEEQLFTIDAEPCDAAVEAGTQAVERIGRRLARDLARAAVLAPAQMGPYVAHAEYALENPRSDYAAGMAEVCRSRHAEFTKAVQERPAGFQQWLAASVLDPAACRALAPSP